MPATYAIVLPARNEEPCLGAVLDELAEVARSLPAVLAVGLNATTDQSRAVAASRPGVLIGESPVAGYGHGCLAAIQAVRAAGHRPSAWIFVSADGSNDPNDLPRLTAAYDRGFPMVIGQRTLRPANWQIFGARRALPNVTLGALTTALTGRPFCDIGPLRLIDDALLRRMDLRELVWGWTIEAQILACRLGARIKTLDVTERPRLAGQQKVSAVSWRQSLRIGLSIAAAACRTRCRSIEPLPVRPAHLGVAG
ncbi:MAG: glycosyltransferase [Verrucomicrobiales bacterium]